MTPQTFLPVLSMLFLSLCVRSFAQNKLLSDPVSRSLGGAQTTLSGLSATTGNPSGLYTLSETQVRLYVQNHFSAIGLHEVGIQWGNAFRFGYGGVSLQQLSYDAYRLQAVQTAITKQLLKNMHLGARMGMVVESVRGYGSQYTLQPVLGFVYRVSPSLLAGAHWQYATAPNYTFHLGIRYQPSTPLQILAESSYTPSVGWKLHTGIAYQPVSILHVRLGIEFPEPQFSFGTGLLIYTFAQLDLALRQHPLLGTSVALGVTFYPNRLKL